MARLQAVYIDHFVKEGRKLEMDNQPQAQVAEQPGKVLEPVGNFVSEA